VRLRRGFNEPAHAADKGLKIKTGTHAVLI
jgi:hypothetical protein